MKKIYLIVIPLAIISIFSLPVIREAKGSHYAGRLIGHILLQTESKGEAWYVYPVNGKRYSLGRPAEAFSVMKKLSIGARHSFITNTSVFPARLSGMILLDVEKSGEAYFIYPGDLKKRYLGRPADAFKIMRELGKGISNKDLVNIPLGQIGEPLGNVTSTKKILIGSVPFTPQAPLGNWSDQRYQDGCEESSALMAVRWAKGQGLTRAEAEKIIAQASDYSLKKYGEYRDISSANAVDWIFKDYFKYAKVALVEDITPDDIIKELAQGRLVILPMNGQIMHNPYYKQPGPPRHMIVVRGYDPANKRVHH